MGLGPGRVLPLPGLRGRRLRDARFRRWRHCQYSHQLAGPAKGARVTVVGSGKMAFFNDLETQEPLRIFDNGTMREPSYETFGEFKLVTRSGEVVSPAIPATEPLKIQCQHFLQSLTTRRPVLSDGNDGLRVVEVVVAINQSIAQRRVPVMPHPALAQAA